MSPTTVQPRKPFDRDWLSAGRLEAVLTGLFLAALFWAARYWHSGQFGLYEDDLTFVPRAAEMTVGEIGNFIYTYLTHLYGHGRPLHDSGQYLLSFLAWRAGGLQTAYLMGYAIEVANILLFYALLRRLPAARLAGKRFALLGGLAYLLFSADTTQSLLTASFALQISLLMLLAAFHSYLSGRCWLAYGLAAALLFHYEAPFTVFLAAPLLALPWDRRMLRELFRHGLVLGGMLVIVVLIRAFVIQEDRVTELGLVSAVTTPLVHMLQGPAVSLGTYFYRSWQTLNALNAEVLVAIAIAFGLIFAALYAFKREKPYLESALSALRRRKLAQLPESWKGLFKLLVSGLVMLALAYPLTFTIRAYAISGRDTRVHLAAVVGAALVVAVSWEILLRSASRSRLYLVGAAAASLFFAFLVGYGFVLQRDYVLAWQYQQDFWTQLDPWLHDAGDGTVILVEPSGLRETRQIGANTWNTPRLLQKIYDFPEEWNAPPRVFILVEGWEEHLPNGDGLFRLDATTTLAPAQLYQTANSREVIFIETANGVFIRRSEPLELGGRSYPLKRSFFWGSALNDVYPKGFLHDYLILGLVPLSNP